jgi:hypothetical protein
MKAEKSTRSSGASAVLPLALPPSAYGFQFYAFPLAIIETDPRSADWVLSNYIQLAYDRSPASPVPFAFYMYDYADNPWLETIRGSQDWFQIPVGEIVDFVKNQLRREYYVYLCLDNFFLPHRWSHYFEHFSHDTLVHGFNDRTRTLRLVGYGRTGKFGTWETSYEDFERAYASQLEMGAPTRQMHCFRLLRDGNYPLDRNLIVRTLEEYLTGSNTSEHFSMLRKPWDRAYGLDVYEPLGKAVRDRLGSGVPCDIGDIRGFHVLWEHKKIMTRRVEVLLRDGGGGGAHLLSQAKKLEGRTFALRMAALAHARMNSPRRLREGIEKLDLIREDDERFVKSFLDYLHSSDGTVGQSPCVSRNDVDGGLIEQA